MPENVTGKVKWFDDDKGFGFVSQDDGEDVFVHFSEIQMPDRKTLQAGQRVTMDVVDAPKGPAAQNVRPD